MLDTPPALTIRRTFQRPPRDAIAALEGALTGQVADALGGLGALDASDQADRRARRLPCRASWARPSPA